MAKMGMIAGIAGTGLQALGMFNSGKAEERAMMQQAHAAKQQAVELRGQAKDVYAAASRRMADADLMSQYFLSNNQALSSAGGFEGTSGDAAKNVVELVSRFDQQKRNILQEGAAQKRAMKREAKNIKQSAGYYQSAAANAGRAGAIGAFGSAFSGLADMYLESWAQSGQQDHHHPPGRPLGWNAWKVWI